MQLSQFGQKFAAQSGIGQLMADLGEALSENPEMLFLGGGNPGRLLDVEERLQQRLEDILADPAQRHALLGIYQSPQGDREFRRSLANFLRQQLGWQLNEANISVSNGSQSAFFILYNLFAGAMPNGDHRRIHLPMIPEYVGYAGVGLSDDFFSATPPTISLLDNHEFKYHVDFSALALGEEVGAMCVSRPTNPTGNVLADDEMARLSALARQRDIPLMIDGAYGLPFPNILFKEAEAHWDENTIVVLSLSKLGLPGVRTGIIVAREDIIRAYNNANTVVSLACGTLGPALVKPLFDSGEITAICDQRIMPFYRDRAAQAANWLREALAGLPFRIHRPEGAIFLWLWFEGLPISSYELYQRLKRRGVLVVPGEEFFVGMGDDWRHKSECIRVSYAQDLPVVQQGIKAIGEEVRAAFTEATS